MDFPTGVELHNGKIRITFTYRGIRCREVLQGWVVNQSNIKKAGNLRAAIVSDIQLGSFDYASRFPESKALQKFSSTRRITTFKELCDVFDAAKALEISASSMDTTRASINTLRRIIGDNTRLVDIQHSDLLSYRKELLTGDIVNPYWAETKRKGRSPSTVNTRMSLLGEMLKLAHRSKFITHTPWEGGTAEGFENRTRSPAAARIPGVFVWAEQEACPDLDPRCTHRAAPWRNKRAGLGRC